MIISELNARSSQLWKRLTDPSALIVNQEERWRARLLASILLAVALMCIPLSALPAVTDPTLLWTGPQFVPSLISTLLLLLGYRISRSRYYQYAAWLTVAGVLAISLVLAYLDTANLGLGQFYYLIAITVFAALFLPASVTALVFVLQMIGMLVFPYVVDHVTLREMLAGPISFNLILTCLIALLSVHRKQLESARRRQLTESEARYRMLVESIRDAVFLHSPEGHFITANSAAEVLTGWSSEEIKHKTFRDFVHPDDKPLIAAMGKVVRSGATTPPYELRMRTRSDEYSWVEVRAAPQFEDGRLAGVSGIVRDITERKKAEQALRESEERIRAIVENANEIIYTVSLKGEITYASPNWTEQLGHNVSEVIGQSFEWIVAAEDVPLLRDMVETIIRTGHKQTGIEYRVRHKDGSWRWHTTSGSIVRDSAGKPAYFVGVARDISERKQADETLRQMAARLEQQARTLDDILSATPDFFGMVDRQGHFLYASPHYLELMGRPLQDVLGKTWRELAFPLEDAARFENHLKTIFETGESSISEGRYLVNDEYRDYERILTPRRDAAGAITAAVMTYRDVTERKQAETALQESQQRLSQQADLHRLVATLARQFINLEPNELDAHINDALRSIGQLENVDRSYIFLLSEDRATVSNTHEWCELGITPQIDTMQNMPVDQMPRLMRRLSRQEVIHVPRLADLPPEAEAEKTLFQMEETQSILVVPMIYNDVLVGFMGFDSVRRERSWSNESVSMLQLMAEVFIHAMELRRTRAALLASEERYRLVSELVSDYAYSVRVDPDGSTVTEWMTDSVVRVTGYGIEDSTIARAPTLVHPDDAERIANDLKATIEGKTNSSEYRVITRSGELKWLRIHRRPVWDDQHKRVVRFYGVAQDITAHKQAEENKLKLALEHDRMALVSRFVRAVSHDFRTSLATIETSRYLTRRFLLNADTDRALIKLDAIHDQVKRLNTQLDNLYTVSALVDVATRPGNVNALVEAALAEVQPLAAANDLMLVFEPDVNLPLIMVDERELALAVQHLLANAIHHTPEGGRITLRTAYADAHVIIEVQDTGCGIAAEHMPHIFDLFYRGDSSRPTTTGGVGLGLSIVKMVAEAHEGIVQVVSAPGEGSTFRIVLPFRMPVTA